MKFKLLNDDSQKTYAIILDTGDEAISCLLKFAKDHRVEAAHFSAIGALSKVTVGFFDFSIKDYRKTVMTEQLEVLSLIGDISIYNGEVKVHAHVVVGKQDASAHGGHLLEAVVHPTLEIIIVESPAYLQRKMDAASEIPLIALD
jgi:predicted DNA-binding protein with PD1-like motif